MKFLSGARNRSVIYIIAPSRSVMDMNTGQATQTPELMAKFVDHQFNSESSDMLVMYQNYARDLSVGGKKVTPEEVKVLVESHLINHPDFGRSDGRGIFLDRTATFAEEELRERGVRRQCLFMQDLGEETMQCPEYVDDPESDFCQAHQALVEATIASRKGHVVQEEVAPKEEAWT